MAAQTRGGAVALERRRAPAGRHRRELLRARPARGARRAAARTPSASASSGIEVLDSIAWVHDSLLPQLRIAGAGSLRPPSTRPARCSGWGCPGSSRRSPPRSPTRSASRPARPAAGWPATAAAAPRAAGLRAARRGRRPGRAPGRRASVQQPHVRDRAAGGHRAPYALLRAAARAPHPLHAGDLGGPPPSQRERAAPAGSRSAGEHGPAAPRPRRRARHCSRQGTRPPEPGMNRCLPEQCGERRGRERPREAEALAHVAADAPAAASACSSVSMPSAMTIFPSA